MRKARIAAALWGGFLFLLTSWPNPPSIATAGFPIDKVTHFGLYSIEAFLLMRVFAPARFSHALAVIGLMAVWGMLDETHQEWIPGRMMDAADLSADLAGALAGTLAALLISAPRRKTLAGLPTSGRLRDRRPRRSRAAGSAP